MKTEMIPAREVVAAIHGAFHRASTCHCHTVAKLGEDDILTYLARRKLIAPADVIEIQSLSIEAITERYGELVIPSNVAWMLRRAGVRLLSDLTNWTYADVLRLDRMAHIPACSHDGVLVKLRVAAEHYRLMGDIDGDLYARLTYQAWQGLETERAARDLERLAGEGLS